MRNTQKLQAIKEWFDANRPDMETGEEFFENVLYVINPLLNTNDNEQSTLFHIRGFLSRNYSSEMLTYLYEVVEDEEFKAIFDAFKDNGIYAEEINSFVNKLAEKEFMDDFIGYDLEQGIVLEEKESIVKFLKREMREYLS